MSVSRKAVVATAVAAVLALTGAAAHASVLIGATNMPDNPFLPGGGYVYSIDPAASAASGFSGVNAGGAAVKQVDGISFAPSGSLWGVSTFASNPFSAGGSGVYQINPQTGAISGGAFINAGGTNLTGITGIAYNAAGQLWALGYSNIPLQTGYYVIQVDPTTGAASNFNFIQAAGQQLPDIEGIAFDPSGKLWGVGDLDSAFTGPLASGGYIFQIDTASGDISDSNFIDAKGTHLPGVDAIAFDSSGQMWAAGNVNSFTTGGYLMSLDSATGEVVDANVLTIAPGSNLPSIRSIAFAPNAGTPPAGGVPEPAAWALMLGGFALAGSALRRARAINRQSLSL